MDEQLNMNGWHFVGDRLMDGSEVPKNGVTLEFDGEPKLCKQGYHAAPTILDALRCTDERYEAFHTLCHVKLEGMNPEGDYKRVGKKRTILWRVGQPELDRILKFVSKAGPSRFCQPPEGPGSHHQAHR